MNTVAQLKHEFVEYIPGEIEEGKLYVSMTFTTAVHKCCCGCGNEVVTPLSPTDWKLIFNGVFISLEPSIGNWGFACKSHYFIRHNKVVWAPRWPQEQIDANRAHDQYLKGGYYDILPAEKTQESLDAIGIKSKRRLWQRFIEWFAG